MEPTAGDIRKALFRVLIQMLMVLFNSKAYGGQAFTLVIMLKAMIFTNQETAKYSSLQSKSVITYGSNPTLPRSTISMETLWISENNFLLVAVKNILSFTGIVLMIVSQ